MDKSDPVIKMMAQCAAADLNFQALMRIVAEGKATINEHKEFQAHVDWLTGIRWRLEREALEAKEARANAQQQTIIDTIAPSAPSSTFPSGFAASPSSLPQGQPSLKDFEPNDQSRFFIPTIFYYNWATLEHFPGNIPPTQVLSSSPPPQPVKSSDGKVADGNLNTNPSLLQNQIRDQVNAMSPAPKAPGATKPTAQATRPPSVTRSASSRDTKTKGAAAGKALRTQPGQNQLTRLGFNAPSSSPSRAPAAQTPVTPASSAATRRGPGYYSAEAPRTKDAAPVTPKKGNNRVHFEESPRKKESDNYYTPKQQDRPASRAISSPGTPTQTSSPARHITASPGTPGTPKKEGKKPGKLVVNMDEVQLYITYSRAYKELEAKMANTPPKKVKDELQEKWARKRKDMELTREQNHRFKKVYKQIQEEDKERAENKKKAQEEAESKQRSTASLGQDGSNVGKRNTSSAVKTGPLKATNDEDYEMIDNVDSDEKDTD